MSSTNCSETEYNATLSTQQIARMIMIIMIMNLPLTFLLGISSSYGLFIFVCCYCIMRTRKHLVEGENIVQKQDALTRMTFQCILTPMTLLMKMNQEESTSEYVEDFEEVNNSYTIDKADIETYVKELEQQAEVLANQIYQGSNESRYDLSWRG